MTLNHYLVLKKYEKEKIPKAEASPEQLIGIKREKTREKDSNQNSELFFIPDTFLLEQDGKKEVKNANPFGVRNGQATQKLPKQPFLLGAKLDFDGDVNDAVMPFKGCKAIENFLESVGLHTDEENVFIVTGNIFNETDRKMFDQVN